MSSQAPARKKTATAERPFVDFYMTHGVIPTRQDISDLDRHFQRRSALYRKLGLVPSHLEGRSIIEFGPGSGHNAVYTLSLNPGRYILVDANQASLQSTSEQVRKHRRETDCQIVDCEIQKFATRERFDLVLCEGVVPTQDDPAAFTRKIAGFVKPGGVLVLTCMDPVSVLPEVLRRYVAHRAVPADVPFAERVARLTRYFTPDLRTLPGMSRKYEDWVIDVVMHPWSGRLYSMASAMEALADQAVLQGSSPGFITDWRWYKDIHGQARFDLSRNLNDYWTHVHAFLDFRSVVASRPAAANRALVRLAGKIYDRVYAVERTGKPYPPAALARDVKKVADSVRSSLPAAARSLDEFARLVGKVAPGKPSPFKQFLGLWGRGQQYVSFVVEK